MTVPSLLTTPFATQSLSLGICNGWSEAGVNVISAWSSDVIRTGLFEEVVCGHSDDVLAEVACIHHLGYKLVGVRCESFAESLHIVL